MADQPSTLFQNRSNLIHECPACSGKTFSDLIDTKVQMHPSDTKFRFQQCQNCQLVFLNPRVPLDQLKSYYTDYYLPYRGPQAWGKFASFVERSQKQLDLERAKIINSVHPLSKASTVLDIGCGKPTFLNVCLQKYATKSIGLDFTDTGWKDQKDTFKGLDLFVGEVKDLNADQRPSVITMWHYLEHDYAPLQTLSSLRKLATADTTLVIEVPNYDSESRRKFGKHWAGYHTPRHTFLFSPDNIRQLLKRAGWQVQEVRTQGTLDPYLLYWMSKMEQEGIDWSKSMQDRFYKFVWNKLRFEWQQRNKKNASLGIMLAIAKAS